MIHHRESSIDEEALFRSFAENWLEGMKHEVASIFGPEKTAELLDLWHRSKL